MKITRIDSYVVDAGWRPWIFVVVEADDGLKGYGECSDGRNPWGVVGTIEDFKPLLIGQDPRAYEMRFWDLRAGEMRRGEGEGGLPRKRGPGVPWRCLPGGCGVGKSAWPGAGQRSQSERGRNAPTYGALRGQGGGAAQRSERG